MNSNRMRNVGLLAAPLAALALLSGCGSDETGTAESSPAPASTTTASAPTTQTGTASPSTTHTDHTQTTTSTAPNPEGCTDRGTERHPRRVEWRRRFCGASGGLRQHGRPHVHTRRFPRRLVCHGSVRKRSGCCSRPLRIRFTRLPCPWLCRNVFGASYERRELPGRSVRRDRRCGTEGLPTQQLRLGLPRLPHQGLLDDRREHQPADGRAGRPLSHGLRRRRPQSAGRRNNPERNRTSAASVNWKRQNRSAEW